LIFLTARPLVCAGGVAVLAELDRLARRRLESRRVAERRPRSPS